MGLLWPSLEVYRLFRRFTHTHTPSFTHNFHTHTRTIFHTQLCHISSWTYNIFNTHFCHTLFHTPSSPHTLTHTHTHTHTTLSHATLSHTIFRTTFCHTLSFTHNLSHTSLHIQPFNSSILHHLLCRSFLFLLDLLFLLLGKSWLVGISGPWFFPLKRNTSKSFFLLLKPQLICELCTTHLTHPSHSLKTQAAG